MAESVLGHKVMAVHKVAAEPKAAAAVMASKALVQQMVATAIRLSQPQEPSQRQLPRPRSGLLPPPLRRMARGPAALRWWIAGLAVGLQALDPALQPRGLRRERHRAPRLHV